MKIKLNEYMLKNTKIKLNKTILAMSDIHSNLNFLDRALKILDTIKVDYIVLPGDIVDILNLPNEKEFLDKIILLSEYAKTFICLGNHDKYLVLNGMLDDEAFKKQAFYNTLKDIPNLTLFTDSFNSLKIEDGISISAINYPNSYFESREKREIFNKFIAFVDSKEDLEETNFNILLSHSPNSIIQNNQIINYSKTINSADLILCGHNHGGLTPTFIQDILNTHTGIIGPYSKFIQKSAYGYWVNDDKCLFISNGVTKIADSSPFDFLHGLVNSILIPEIDLIHLENNQEVSFELIKRKKYKI